MSSSPPVAVPVVAPVTLPPSIPPAVVISSSPPAAPPKTGGGFDIGPIHITAFVFGVIIIILVLLFVYYKGMAETFIDPSLDPQSAALLAFHNAEDPTSAASLKKMYKEHIENKLENPKLVAMLYR
jgi:hypothetical protein